MGEGSAPAAAEPGADPVGLSRPLLECARAAEGPEECAALDALAEGLRDVDPARIEGDDARLAFWINLYNALVRHELCRRPRSGNLLLHRRMFRSARYRVGDHDYSPDVIEHGVLRRNRRAPLTMRRALGGSDPRLDAMPSMLDPRVHFALNCAARSCPPIREYSAGELDEQLELATRAYVRAETTIDREVRRVTLPRLLRIYRADFGSTDERLEFAAARLPVGDAEWLAGRDGLRIGYGRYDWTIAVEA